MTGLASATTVSALVTECTCAAPAGGAAIAEALTSLVAVLLKRTAAMVPQEHAAPLKLAQAGLERLRSGSSGDPYLLWSPAIATVRNYLLHGDGAAAALQLLYLLRDAGGMQFSQMSPPAIPATIYTRGRYLRVGGAAAALAAGTARTHDGVVDGGEACSASPLHVAWGASGSKFLLPTRETIIDRADVDILWPAPFGDHGVPHETLNRAAATLQQAAEWIRSVSPSHFNWITRLIRGFAITEMPAGSDLSSGSYITRPGIVHISFPLDMLLVAETLIHEASHQHYMVMNSVVRLVDPTASTTVFSPIKGTHRPLDRTLFAYHACFNIWDFFRRVDDVQRAGEAAQRGELMYAYATTMGRSMTRVGDLTPVGAALSGDLRQRLSVDLDARHDRA